MTKSVSHRDVHSNVGIDWSDPEQAALQVKIDTLRGMIARNPMSYSEKDEMVRAQMKDQARREEANENAKKKPREKWDI